MRAARCAAVLAVVLAAGCAARTGPPAEGAQARPEPPDQIEGRYRGIARLTRAEGRGCPRSGNRTVTVEGGSFTVRYRSAASSGSVNGSVAGDGSIHGSDGRGSVDGRISGRHMDLTVSTDQCEERYALDHI